MRAAPPRCTSHGSRRRRRGVPQALPVFCCQVLQHHIIQRQVRDHTLKFRVLFQQVLQTLRVAHIHATVPALPRIERRRAYSVLSTQVRCLNSAFLLLDHADDLFFAKPTLLQLSSPSAATSAAWVSLDYAGPILGVKVRGTSD